MGFDDDDRHWFAGTIYFNREDRRLLVPKRLGLGFGRTLNLAHPASWAVLALPILIALAIALSRR